MKQMMMKVRQVFSTDLVKVSFLNGISTVIRMLAGVVSTKVVASVVGPVGIALLGQLSNFTTIILSLANGGITTGITKYISEHSEKEEKTSLYIGTAFRITFIFSLITGLVMIIGAGYFSNLILKGDEYRSVFYIFGITIIFYALNALLLAILNGFKEYKLFVRVNIISSLTSLLFSVVMALSFGLMGALISVVTFQSVVFLITLVLVSKTPWFSWSMFLGRIDRKSANNLIQYSIMALATAIIVPLSQLLVRGYIAGKLSVTDAGIWESVNRISGMYLMVVVTSFSVYYLPRLAELKNDSMIRKEVMSVYQLMIPFLIVASIGIYILRDLIIAILFTSEFNRMGDLLPFQLIGDILKMSGWVLGYLMVAKAMTRTYIFMEILNYALFVVLSYILISFYGVKGATIAYAIGHLIYLVGMFIIFRKMMFGNGR
ncbi:MAG TPA: O-antigen translocase [Chitinophagaceae bacterium]|nr:O-antigen translocase [Chitinophagaceae bacterium]